MSTTAERIRSSRKALGMTLQDLADASNSSKSYIWELENKDSKRPSVNKISSIAEVLGLTTDYLIGIESKSDSIDEAFYSAYLNMTPKKKSQLRDIQKVIAG